MIVVLVPLTPSAVVDRIEDEDIAVLEVPCPDRHAPTPHQGAWSTMGRRGDIPPPQRLPPHAGTSHRRDRQRASTLDTHRAPASSVVFVDLPLSHLPVGLREGDFVPLAALPLPPSDVCSGSPHAHGAREGAGSRPDTTRARALPGTP